MTTHSCSSLLQASCCDDWTLQRWSGWTICRKGPRSRVSLPRRAAWSCRRRPRHALSPARAATPQSRCCAHRRRRSCPQRCLSRAICHLVLLSIIQVSVRPAQVLIGRVGQPDLLVTWGVRPSSKPRHGSAVVQVLQFQGTNRRISLPCRARWWCRPRSWTPSAMPGRSTRGLALRWRRCRRRALRRRVCPSRCACRCRLASAAQVSGHVISYG